MKVQSRSWLEAIDRFDDWANTAGFVCAAVIDVLLHAFVFGTVVRTNPEVFAVQVLPLVVAVVGLALFMMALSHQHTFQRLEQTGSAFRRRVISTALEFRLLGTVSSLILLKLVLAACAVQMSSSVFGTSLTWLHTIIYVWVWVFPTAFEITVILEQPELFQCGGACSKEPGAGLLFYLNATALYLTAAGYLATLSLTLFSPSFVFFGIGSHFSLWLSFPFLMFTAIALFRVVLMLVQARLESRVKAG